MNGSTGDLFSPARLGSVELRNRVVKSGTNEGMSRQGLVTDRLIEWHREFAAGGVGMTTLAYCSVAPEGRTFEHQIWMRDEALSGLRRFTNAMHAEDARASIQLGHAGWFANPKATGTPPLGPSRMFSPYAQTFSRSAEAADLDRLERDFAAAAKLAVDAGFDALEIHLGHGYLLSQFLCPYSNRRRDDYGGSLENRARFPRRVVRAVRRAVASDVAVYAKFNMDDGFEGGLTLADGVRVARWIEADGSLDALQLTGGHTTKSAMYLLRELIALEKSFLRRVGMRVLAPLMLKSWAFEEAFFLGNAREFRVALTMPLMLLGGVTRLDTMQAAIAAGFDFVALGHALIRNPDLVKRLQTGELTASECTPCNQCIIEMEKGGTRCVMRGHGSPTVA
jgi:2,4-dienoyl-CoA reductase-like NADH-dependent reductase (Old Yellow Enzyme family)